MAAKLEENIHQIHDWHRVAECMPLLDSILRGLEREIDLEILAADPGVAEYEYQAVGAWAERRAVDKLRKALTKIIKRGKTASKTIAPSM